MIAAAGRSAQLPLIVSYALSGVLGIAATLLLGGLIYKFALKRFQRDMTGSFVVSVGLSLLLTRVFLETFGGVPIKAAPAGGGHGEHPGAFVTVQRLIITGCALLVAVFMCWTIVSSRLG